MGTPRTSNSPWTPLRAQLEAHEAALLQVGGVKLSGYGREPGRTGMLQPCNLQTVWMA